MDVDRTDLPDLRKLALEEHGADAQLTKLAEEAGELVAAIARYFEGEATLAEVYEEAVGVEGVLLSLWPFFVDELDQTERVEILDEQAEKLAAALEGA